MGNNTEQKKFNIILTCEGGSGHKAAANSIRDALVQNKEEILLVNATDGHWLSPTDEHFDLCPFVISHWNRAQQNGNVTLLRAISNLRSLSIFSRSQVKNSLKRLISEQAKLQEFEEASEIEIHNTTPVCISSMVSVVAEYNLDVQDHNKKHPDNLKKTIKFINYFTDVPSQEAVMFIDEMEALDPKELKAANFELRTLRPVLSDLELSGKKEQTDKTYHSRLKQLYPKLYQNLTKNSNDEEVYRVKFTDGPVREEFLKYKEKPANRKDLLSLSFTNQEEYELLKSTIGDELLVGDYHLEKNSASIDLVAESDKAEIVTVMLGSQADIEGTKAIINSELELKDKSESKEKRPKYLFVFCGPNDPESGKVLYSQVLEMAKANKDKNIKIIPLANQNAKTISQLYSVADLVNIRPGGISVMEANLVVRGRVIVYSVVDKLTQIFHSLFGYSKEGLEAKYQAEYDQDRLDDLVVWEAGNAKLLQQTLKDDFDNPKVSLANMYSYQYTRELDAKKNKVAQYLRDGKNKEAIEFIGHDEDLCHRMLLANGKLRNIASMTLLLKNLKEVQAKYSKLKNKELSNYDYHKDFIDSITKDIDDDYEAISINPFDSSSILRLHNRYKNIIKKSNKLIKDIENDITINNKDSILGSLKIIIFEILSKIPLLNNLFGNFFDLNNFFIKKELKLLNAEVSSIKENFKKDSHEGFEDNVVNLIETDNAEWESARDILSKIDSDENKAILISHETYKELTHSFLGVKNEQGEIDLYIISNDVLGEGGFGRVNIIQNEDGHNFVLKTYHEDNNEIIASMIAEDRTLKRLGENKGNLIKIGRDNYLMQKMVLGNTLHHDIVSWFPVNTDNKKFDYALSLTEALFNVSAHGVVHGDLMPKNIMVNKVANACKSKLIDFGLSEILHENYNGQEDIKFTKHYASPDYSAPEVFFANDIGMYGVFNFKSDVYSMGIILKKNLGYSDAIVDKMISILPSERPSIEEVYKHLLMAKIVKHKELKGQDKEYLKLLEILTTVNNTPVTSISDDSVNKLDVLAFCGIVLQKADTDDIRPLVTKINKDIKEHGSYCSDDLTSLLDNSQFLQKDIGEEVFVKIQGLIGARFESVCKFR
tara:strand:- start:275 stop:3604 length:3330 start_codon:yes stop_codon:yes gene_type:complete